jgi:glycosyltransferase involved in cell wall biosynthesis
MHVGIVVISEGIGGAEKRFARLFNYLSAHSAHKYTILLPQRLCRQLCEQGILSENQPNILKLFQSFPGSLFNHYYNRKFYGLQLPGIWHILLPIWRQEWNASQVQSALAGFDVVHFCNTHPLQIIPENKPVILEEPNSASQVSISPQVVSWLSQGVFLSCLSESIQIAYLQATEDIARKDRINVAPCSFIDYENTFVSAKERLIVFVGRMEDAKNPRLFLSAMEILAKYRQDFKAILLGTGSLDRQLDMLIMRSGLQAIVTRLFHSKPQEVLSRSLVFVSIQEFDNYPSQALLEAMACGCAIIASDVGQTGKLVSDDVGYRVPLVAEAIAEKLSYALDHFDESVEMGKCAREKVLREHKLEIYTSYLEELYERVVR